MVAQRDHDLLKSIASVPNIRVREHLVHHLSPDATKRVTRHIKSFILQKKGYKIKNAAEKQALTKALQPHHKEIRQLMKLETRQQQPELRKQKGGQIFAFLISVLAPIVVDLIVGAVSKKK